MHRQQERRRRGHEQRGMHVEEELSAEVVRGELAEMDLVEAGLVSGALGTAEGDAHDAVGMVELVEPKGGCDGEDEGAEGPVKARVLGRGDVGGDRGLGGRGRLEGHVERVVAVALGVDVARGLTLEEPLGHSEREQRGNHGAEAETDRSR